MCLYMNHKGDFIVQSLHKKCEHELTKMGIPKRRLPHRRSLQRGPRAHAVPSPCRMVGIWLIWGFPELGVIYSNSWMVYSEKSHEMGWFGGIYGNAHLYLFVVNLGKVLMLYHMFKKMRRFSGFSGMKNSPTAQTLGFLLVNRLILVYGFKQFQKCELVNRDHCRKNGKTW